MNKTKLKEQICDALETDPRYDFKAGQFGNIIGSFITTLVGIAVAQVCLSIISTSLKEAGVTDGKL